MVTRNTHDMDLDHFGAATDAQLAGGSATTGDVPVSNGDGTRTWGTGGGSSGGTDSLLTGDDQYFDSSNGNWTASGGTLTHDTTTHLTNFNGALKHVTTSTNQYVEVPVAGTFTAGKSYFAILLVRSAASLTASFLFGLQGTDTASNTSAVFQFDDFIAVSSHWRPGADRTGVTVRFSVPASGATYFIGWALVFQSDVAPVLNNSGYTYSPFPAGFTSAHIGPITNSGLILDTAGRSKLESAAHNAGLDVSNAFTFQFAQHTPGDLAATGHNIEAGTDSPGMWISEKDSTTLQVYPESSNDVELSDFNTTHRWKVNDRTYVTPLGNMSYVQAGTVDPSAGGGVAAPIGATYHRNNSGSGELWLKTGSGNTAWTHVAVP